MIFVEFELISKWTTTAKSEDYGLSSTDKIHVQLPI